MHDEGYWARAIDRPLSRRRALRAGALGVSGLAGAVLIGCATEDDAPPAPAPTPSEATPEATPVDGEPRTGGVLGLVAGRTPDNFNPVINTSEAWSLSAQHIYDSLISSRAHDERLYVPIAAESVELPDDTTVVFQLKEGLVYQDRPPVNGRAVIADDVVTMQEYVRDEERALDPMFQRDSMESVEAPDDRTVVFHLQEPNAYLFSNSHLGLPHNNGIIPSELVLGDLDSMEPVGSGPYQLKAFQFGVRYEYERSPSYRDADKGLPYIDERVVIALTDPSALEAAFRSEQIGVWVPPAETADRLERDMGDTVAVEEYLAPNLFTWNMSSKRPHFDDVRVREAFYRAFDPLEFIELVANGWAAKTPGKLSWALEAYQIDEADVAEYIRHDPQEARQLLDAAGFDFDRTYELTTFVGAVNESSLQVFSEQIRRVGVVNQTSIVTAVGEWLPGMALTGNYDFIGGASQPGWNTPVKNMRMNHSNPRQVQNSMNPGDPEIDEMIDRSEMLVDREENIALVKEIQLELTRRYAHLSHVYTPINRELRFAYVKDWETNPFGTQMHRPEAWLDL